MDILLIIVTVVMILIIFGVSFYMIAIFCHSEEKAMGSSIVTKIIVVLGLGLSWGQVLLIPLDVSNTNSNGGIDMQTFYNIVYIIILVYLAGISPFTMFLYQSDEEDSMCKRITWSLIFTIILGGILCAVIFVSGIWLSEYSPGNKMDTALYIMVVLSFFGWILLAIYGGIGIAALPGDFIAGFVNRPKVLKPEEAKEKKEGIEKASSELVGMGEHLKEEEELLNKSEGWWATRKQKNKVDKMFQKFKQNVIKLEEDYDVFQAELKIQQQNPIIPVLQLILGIVCVLISLVWVLQITFDVILRPGGTPVWSVLNGMFTSLNNQGLNFISTGIFGILTIYLLWCTQKGNIKFGLRIPFIVSFHPMKKNETFLNSLLFNVNLMMLASVATTQLSVFAFSGYTSNCYIGKIFSTQINNLPFFGWIYTKRVFPMAMMAILLLQILYVSISSCLKKNKQKKEAESKRK